ncbi:hypothetical protein IOC57_09000 [Bacillus sp. SD075]|uniref:hypothetical protein n=1 Tax=Bacillus sp. SD075 TaxID=2781732 RepID=UPI001A957613|nr:hypothetical protein [Bacillus sp. SD075]MBO0997883.1 hypothetical protein [Bacillus sp. SD075]
MNYKKKSSNKVTNCGITVKFERGGSDRAYLTKLSFFDALQHVNSPFEKNPRSDSPYQDFPLRQEITLSFLERGAKTSINYDPHQEKIIIEEISETFQTNKGEALTAILDHIMINHGNHHSFFIIQQKERNAKRKAATPCNHFLKLSWAGHVKV